MELLKKINKQKEINKMKSLKQSLPKVPIIKWNFSIKDKINFKPRSKIKPKNKVKVKVKKIEATPINLSSNNLTISLLEKRNEQLNNEIKMVFGLWDLTTKKMNSLRNTIEQLKNSNQSPRKYQNLKVTIEDVDFKK